MMGRRPSLERVIFEKLGSLASCGSHGMCGHTMCSDWIRTYPPRFGLHLASLFDKLVNSRCDPPEIPVDLASMPLPAFFESLSWESDLCVGGCIFLVDVLCYIRGNRSMDLGPTWRPLFPEAL